MSEQPLYTADQVKEQLSKAMAAYQKGMIGILREVAENDYYRNLTGEEALNKVANRLEGDA